MRYFVRKEGLDNFAPLLVLSVTISHTHTHSWKALGKEYRCYISFPKYLRVCVLFFRLLAIIFMPNICACPPRISSIYSYFHSHQFSLFKCTYHPFISTYSNIFQSVFFFFFISRYVIESLKTATVYFITLFTFNLALLDSHGATPVANYIHKI